MDKYFDFKDIQGFYTDEGQGDVILLLHGFGLDGGMWHKLKPGLIKTHRLLIPDLPGYRNTPLSSKKLTIEWMADYIKTLLDHEKIKKITFVGHSMGGYIALAFAEKYPQYLERLCMFHSHPYADGPEKIDNRKRAIDFIKRNGTHLFVNELHNNLFAARYLKTHYEEIKKLKDAAFEYTAESLIASTRAMIDRPDRSDVLENLNLPVLFIIGKEDGAIPYEWSLKQTHLPELADIHILDGVGHMGMIEAHKKCLNYIQEFCKLNSILN